MTAYPLSVLLGFTVMVWLVVGAYISFIFVPKSILFCYEKSNSGFN